MAEKLTPSTKHALAHQFGIKAMLLLVSCVAFVLAMRNVSIRQQTEAWIAYAPIYSAVIITFGFRIFGMGRFKAVAAGTLFAFLASVAHAVEMIARSPAFAFLRGHKVDLSDDPLINGIKVLVTTGEAVIAVIVIVLVLAVASNSRGAAG